MTNKRPFANDFIQCCKDLGMSDETIAASLVPYLQSANPITEPIALIEPETNTELRQVCDVCYGEGYYYEDVCGDGGPQMRIECECQDEVTE